MASEAGIYKHLWRPEEIGATHARDIIDALELGLTKLKGDPDHFRKFNPANGWGTYEGLIHFVESYLEACKSHPDAMIQT